MKKIFSVIFSILILFLFFRFFVDKKIVQKLISPQYQNTLPTSMPLSNPLQPPVVWPYQITVPYDNSALTVNYIEIPESAKLTLIPNFSQKDSGEALVNKYGCNYAVNSGFYQEDGTPLGLFMTDGAKYGEKIISNIATGYFWQDKNNNRGFGKNPPDLDSLDLVFQAGPLIIPGNYQLKMISDEKARRILIAGDKQNKLYLMSVFDRENNFSGPNLADLPAIFASSSIQEVIPVTSILNLDGGAASFFFAQEKNVTFSLLELTPIGSLICIKNI